MHENKYLHLPVVDESDGTVLGVVSVMEIIQATAGDRGSSRYCMMLLIVIILELCIDAMSCFHCSFFPSWPRSFRADMFLMCMI